jgi:hypothetical protein
MKTTKETLTPSEKSRLAEIRKSINNFKRQGVYVGAWENEFFLKIIDRLMRRLGEKRG